jgi:hypothetical protein
MKLFNVFIPFGTVLIIRFNLRISIPSQIVVKSPTRVSFQSEKIFQLCDSILYLFNLQVINGQLFNVLTIQSSF